MTSDGRRVLVHAGFVLALLGALASSLVIWFFSALTFFGEPLTGGDYRHMVLGFGLGAALLALALLPARALGTARWVGVTAVVLAVLCTLAALFALVEGQSVPPGPGAEPWWWPLQLFTWLPTTWPLALLVLATPWLGRSARG